MNQLRYGIMSTGNIAHQFAQGVASARRSTCAAVGSRGDDKARAFAQNYSIPNAHGSYDALLADETVDAVYIGLPNHMHHEWTLKALEAGKHVLCEKPLAVTAKQAREMFDAARQHQRVLVEAFMYRTHPQTQRIVDVIRTGSIGKLKAIRASFCFNVRQTQDNIRFSVEAAGGAIMDIGCYCVDLGQLLADDRIVSVGGTSHLHETGVDDYTSASIAFGNGVICSFLCGTKLQASNTAIICGDEGYIEVEWPWKPSDDASILVRGMTPPRQDADQPQRTEQRLDTTADLPLYALEADDFAATVLDDKAPLKSPEQSIETAEALEELRRQGGLPF